VVPRNIPAYGTWLEKTAELTTRLHEHEAALQALRAKGASDAEADRGRIAGERGQREAPPPTRSSWTFTDEGDQLRHDKLSALVAGLQGLLGSASPSAATVAGIKGRLADARALERRLEEDDADLWRRCVEDLATPDGSDTEPVTLAPIPGLVPLGRDRDSRLWEFWHIGSGARPEWEADATLPFGKVKLHKDSGAEGIVMVLIPGGVSRMGSMAPDAQHLVGSPNVDDQRLFHESPVHDVSLAPYMIAKHEVSQAQWMRLFGSNPSQNQPGATPAGERITPRMPVTNVNWYQSREACRRWGLALPTEARWERACRAGTSTRYSTGDSLASLKGFANTADRTFARAGGTRFDRDFEDGFVVQAPIGALKPNGFGLHDMHGNVSEWCLDGYDAKAYRNRTPAVGDGLRTPWRDARLRVYRGGTFHSVARAARSAHRGRVDPDYLDLIMGFRPALSIAPF